MIGLYDNNGRGDGDGLGDDDSGDGVADVITRMPSSATRFFRVVSLDNCEVPGPSHIRTAWS